jgi:geranylgeranyl pyrophosphate synthase
MTSIQTQAPAVNESWYPETSIEWWFAQGYYEARKSPREYFMISFFRQLLDKKTKTQGYTLMSSLFSSGRSQNRVLSQVDKDVFDWFVKNAGKKKRYARYVAEIRQNGPIPPLELCREKPAVASDRLAIQWDGFFLRQEENRFEIGLPRQVSGRENLFRARSLTPVFTIMQETDPDDPAAAMHYRTYPVCELEGRIGNLKVTGRAWIDHQWGSYGMFLPGREKDHPRGWNWFGINLEDGSSWVVWVNRDLRSQKILSSRAVCMTAAGQVKHHAHIAVNPTRHWESPVTYARYPVEWEISVPAENIRMFFNPLTDDQEIPVFGVYRALWEGCGTALFRQGNQCLSGTARGEFFGYAYLHEFRDYVSGLESRIKNNMAIFFPNNSDEDLIANYIGPSSYLNPTGIYDKAIFRPLWDLMNRNGKLWRPCFGLLMLESLGCSCKDYEMLISVGPELSHTGSLIIDDIEDNSPLRRGDAAIHVKYGINTAINAANMVYFFPFLQVIDQLHLTDEQKIRIYEVMVRSYISAHLGQASDIHWSNNMTWNRLEKWLKHGIADHILQAYSLKTGAILKSICHTACIIAGSAERTLQACHGFAENMGIAFQIMDDIRNFNPRISRKSYGEDIAEGKLTHIVVQALLHLDKNDRVRLGKILCDPVARKDKGAIENAISLIKKSGRIEACREQAKQMFFGGWKDYSACTVQSEQKIVLKLLCLKLLDL